MNIEGWLQLAVHGPAHLRFVVQPLVAIVLAARDGSRDARNGEPPFLLSLFSDRWDRRARLRGALRSIVVPLVIGVLLDGVVQYLLLRTVQLRTAVLVGALLVALPYSMARGVSCRIFVRLRHRRARAPA